jgi:Putative DNA-binding domain
MRGDPIKKALEAKRESKYVEFKEAFDGTGRAWCRLVKAVVAMANSGGGVIVFGVRNDGKAVGKVVSTILAIDPADVTNKINSYTSVQFSGFDILEGKRSGRRVALFVVQPASTPIVFTRDGTYQDNQGKPKSVFSIGTVLFRHGAKSEPGNTDDLRIVIERHVEQMRKDLVNDLKRVADAPIGSQIVIQTFKSRATDAARTVYIPSSGVSSSGPSFKRTEDQNADLLLHEELSDDLFKEINNVVEANILLSEGGQRFVFAAPLYYRIYAHRNQVKTDLQRIELLARTALQQVYGPSLYWLLRLPIERRMSIIREFSENPKNPYVHTLIRIMVLLGAEAEQWLFDVWKRKWPGKGQHIDFYWKLNNLIVRKNRVGPKHDALRTLSGPNIEIEDEGRSFNIQDLLASSETANNLLTRFCLRVFDGDSDARGVCRKLDVLAYGDEFQQQAKLMRERLIQS